MSSLILKKVPIDLERRYYEIKGINRKSIGHIINEALKSYVFSYADIKKATNLFKLNKEKTYDRLLLVY